MWLDKDCLQGKQVGRFSPDVLSLSLHCVMATLKDKIRRVMILPLTITGIPQLQCTYKFDCAIILTYFKFSASSTEQVWKCDNQLLFLPCIPSYGIKFFINDPFREKTSVLIVLIFIFLIS